MLNITFFICFEILFSTTTRLKLSKMDKSFVINELMVDMLSTIEKKLLGDDSCKQLISLENKRNHSIISNEDFISSSCICNASKSDVEKQAKCLDVDSTASNGAKESFKSETLLDSKNTFNGACIRSPDEKENSKILLNVDENESNIKKSKVEIDKSVNSIDSCKFDAVNTSLSQLFIKNETIVCNDKQQS